MSYINSDGCKELIFKTTRGYFRNRQIKLYPDSMEALKSIITEEFQGVSCMGMPDDLEDV